MGEWVPADFAPSPGMAVPCVLLLTVLGAEVTSKSSDGLESELDCCTDAMEANSSCLADNPCSPGCYRRWNEDGSSACIKCTNETEAAPPVYNLTGCHEGGPEVAASLIFGTFVISVFLILCVASFFYLKRANKLPNLFYRRNKVRKPRYVRRDRSLAASSTSTSTTLSAETRVSNV
ncbi:hypothetical protein lerEdw1_019760 [Lerista edwardsae]|nr:hypothetical protein lerEdw1_019760 [Lerista edwardsae]